MNVEIDPNVENDYENKVKKFFKDPIKADNDFEPRQLTDSEVARNFMNCIFICLMQLTMAISTIKYFNKPS